MPPPEQQEAGETKTVDNQTRAVPIPKPKPAGLGGAPIEPEGGAAEASEIKEANLKPGSVIRVGKRLLAIPMPKPASR